MESLTRRGFGFAGMGAALASAGAGRAQASGSAGFHGMSDAGRVRLKQIASIDMPRSHEHVMSMSWSPDGSRLVAVSGALNIFDMTTLRLRARFPVMGEQWTRLFGFSADGKELIASRSIPLDSNENNPPAFSVFETDTGRILRESEVLPVFLPDILGRPGDFFLQRRRGTQSLTVSPDGRYVIITLIVAPIPGGLLPRPFAFLFDSQTGRHLNTAEGPRWSLPTISKDNRFASAAMPRISGTHSEASVFDLPSFQKRLVFPTRSGFMRSLAWSPEGDRLAGGMADQSSPREKYDSITIWNATSGERLAGFASGIEPIRHLDWHPGGKFIVMTSAKGTGDRGSLLQLLPAAGGVPAYRHFASGSTLINGPCFCPRTARLAWHERGKILIHEIQGL
jgi:WD40 repeat protein